MGKEQDQTSGYFRRRRKERSTIPPYWVLLPRYLVAYSGRCRSLTEVYRNAVSSETDLLGILCGLQVFDIHRAQSSRAVL